MCFPLQDGKSHYVLKREALLEVGSGGAGGTEVFPGVLEVVPVGSCELLEGPAWSTFRGWLHSTAVPRELLWKMGLSYTEGTRAEALVPCARVVRVVGAVEDKEGVLCFAHLKGSFLRIPVAVQVCGLFWKFRLKFNYMQSQWAKHSQVEQRCDKS